MDHSELLNYELELTNKPRDDHMNWLVYKKGMFKGAISAASTARETDASPSMSVSKILFDRLNCKAEEKDSTASARDNPKMETMISNRHKLSY